MRIQVDGNPKILKKDDLIILFMGPTGSGKSHIIDTLSRRQGHKKHASSHLQSSTSAVSATRIQQDNIDLVLVDTPGFDDTHKSDMEILEIISKWLVQTYKNHFRIVGIVYLHRITDNRRAETVHRNFHVFSELCGQEATKNVMLVTTMWDELEAGDSGEAREEELRKNLWATMITHGARTTSFLNTPESAQNLVETVIGKGTDNKGKDESIEAEDVNGVSSTKDSGGGKGVVLQLQKEIVDAKKRLKETQAAQALYMPLSIILARQARETVKEPNDPEQDVDLNEEYKIIQQQIDHILNEIGGLPTTFTRRILEWGKNAIHNARALPRQNLTTSVIVSCGKRDRSPGR